MISVLEAHNQIDAALPRVEDEEVNFSAASGRVLRQEIVAAFPQPRFSNSAMDGYAIRFKDLKGATKESPVVLNNVGTIACGAAAKVKVKKGQCAQIMTGGMLPPGADAVVMVEQTSGFEGDQVSFFAEAADGQNIRKEGEELAKDTLMIKSGQLVGPAELGILATFGYARVKVAKRPRVCIYGTGDELREPGQELAPAEIYNSNLHVIADLARRFGAEVVHCGVIRDRPEALTEFLGSAVEKSDIVISSGGVSMGRFDYVKDVAVGLGLETRFWRVAQKPGKPLFFATGMDTLLFGLPGNPVSSFINFLEYVAPAIMGWQGIRFPPKQKAILSAPFPREVGKHRFLFGEVTQVDGQLKARPSEKIGSHMMSSALRANAILSTIPGPEPLAVGDKISVQLLPWANISRG
jgi:molybdopterin molybdotransferase